MLLSVIIAIFIHSTSYCKASLFQHLASADVLEKPISNIQFKVPIKLNNLNHKHVTKPYYFNGNVKGIKEMHEELDERINGILNTKAIDDERPMFFANNEKKRYSFKKDLSKSSYEMDSNEKHNSIDMNEGAENSNEIKTASDLSALDLVKRCVFLLSAESNGKISISDTKFETSIHMCREIINKLKSLYEKNVFDRNNDDVKNILKYRDEPEATNKKNEEIGFGDKCDLNGEELDSSNNGDESILNNEQLRQLITNKLPSNGYVQWFVPTDGRRNWMVLNEEYPA